jgi:hypothetical protein
MKMLILDKPKWKVSFRVMSCYPTDVWQLGLAAAPRYSSALLLCIAVIPSIKEILCSYSV